MVLQRQRLSVVVNIENI